MDKVSQIFGEDLDYFLEPKVVNIYVRENNGQICCGNSTINNNCPELLLEELKKLIVTQNELIALLKKMLEK